MKNFSISSVFSRAWKMSCDYWPILVLLNFLTFGISEALNFNHHVSFDPVNPNPEEVLEALAGSMWSFGNILSILIAVYFSYVMLKMTRRAYNTGVLYDTFANAFKIDLNSFALFLGVYLVLGLALVTGYLFCIIPGIFLTIRLMFTSVIAATEDVSFSDAFKKSWEMTKGNFWKLLGFELACFGIVIAGLCVCLVGVLFAEVIVLFATIIAYEDLLPETTPFEEIRAEETPETPHEETPIESTDNYQK